MAIVSYQISSDDAEKLEFAESAVKGGEPKIKIGLPNGDQHDIVIKGELKRGVGFDREKDGTVTIRFNQGGQVLRRYNGWTWIEGATYVPKPAYVQGF